MLMWRNKKNINTFGLKKASYQELCLGYYCIISVQVDAINYYTEEEATLKEQCEAEKVKAFQEPLGVAFVTFENVATAER